MAKMSISSQNTICIRAVKPDIIVVNPCGKGRGMLNPQKNGQKWSFCKDILVKPISWNTKISKMFK
jgi:hypothetical protein